MPCAVGAPKLVRTPTRCRLSRELVRPPSRFCVRLRLPFAQSKSFSSPLAASTSVHLPDTSFFLAFVSLPYATRAHQPPQKKSCCTKENDFFKHFLLPGATVVVVLISLDQRSPQHKTQPTKMGGAMTKKAKDQVPSFCVESRFECLRSFSQP